jgi:ABC-2 type transport system ATP-binding protein
MRAAVVSSPDGHPIVPPAALAVHGVIKRFGRKPVLRGVSYEAFRGEILGIVGENGVGKSTLLRITVGLLRPSAGIVRIAGRLGYCDQEPRLFPDLTVDEHFAYFARAYGLANAGAWQARRDALLEHFVFTGHRGLRAAHLSGGTRQKLHLSLALLHRPDVLVLDEPYLAFDWETYLRFWEYAESARRAGAAIVVVSHVAHDRERFSRVLALREGVLQCE